MQLIGIRQQIEKVTQLNNSLVLSEKNSTPSTLISSASKGYSNNGIS